MRVAVRCVSAGAALALTAAVAPITPRLLEEHIGSPALHLAASDSLLNVPVNLLIDLANIPYNEVHGLNVLEDSLFQTGTWMVQDSTNIWGTDPGDPGHWQALVSLLVPFPELAGQDAYDPDGLGYQLWNLAAAELPVSAFCDAETCLPVLPTVPITGITFPDQLLWAAAIATGLQKFPLIDNWFQVPISELTAGYHYGPVIDPSGPAQTWGSLLGTHDAGGVQNLMPWADNTFTFDPLHPWEHFFDSLMADPSTNPLEFPDPMEFARTIQSVLAGLVIDFDPFTPGSGLCPGACVLPESLTVPAIVNDIGSTWPGNDSINTWLNGFAADPRTVNWPTPEQIDYSIQVLHPPFFDTGNPPLPPGWPDVEPQNLSSLLAAVGDPDKLSALTTLLALNGFDLGQLDTGGLPDVIGIVPADLGVLSADLIGNSI